MASNMFGENPRGAPAPAPEYVGQARDMRSQLQAALQNSPENLGNIGTEFINEVGRQRLAEIPGTPEYGAEQERLRGTAIDLERARQAQRAQYGGQGFGAPQMVPVTSSVTTTQRTSPLYSPQEAAAMQQSIGAQTGQVQQAAEQQKLAIWGEIGEIESARNELMQERARVAELNKGLAGRLQNAEQSYDAAKKRVDAAQINPQRYWEQMPTLGKTMNVIGLALGGFVEGFSRGAVKNRVPGMISEAIARDIQAQRIELDKRMQQMGLAERDRNRLLQRFDAGQDKRRQLALDMSKLGLLRAAAAQKLPSAQLRAAELVGQLERERIKVGAESRPRVSQQTTTKTEMAQVQSLGGGGQLPTDKTELRNLRKELGDNRKATGALVALREELIRLKNAGVQRPNLFKGWSTTSQKLQSKIKPIIGLVRTQMGDSGRMSDYDAKFFNFVEKDKLGGLTTSTDDMLELTNSMLGDVRRNGQNIVKTYTTPLASQVQQMMAQPSAQQQSLASRFGGISQ